MKMTNFASQIYFANYFCQRFFIIFFFKKKLMFLIRKLGFLLTLNQCPHKIMDQDFNYRLTSVRAWPI